MIHVFGCMMAHDLAHTLFVDAQQITLTLKCLTPTVPTLHSVKLFNGYASPGGYALFLRVWPSDGCGRCYWGNGCFEQHLLPVRGTPNFPPTFPKTSQYYVTLCNTLWFHAIVYIKVTLTPPIDHSVHVACYLPWLHHLLFHSCAVPLLFHCRSILFPHTIIYIIYISYSSPICSHPLLGESSEFFLWIPLARYASLSCTLDPPCKYLSIVLNCEVALTVENSPLIGLKVMHATIIGQFSVDNDDDENCSCSTPSVAHNSPSPYISATEIPLPEDTMEDNSNCLSAMEKELGSQCQSLNDIHDQLIMLIAFSRGENPHVEAPPAVTNAVVAPFNPPNTTTHWLKPVTPSEFTRDCTKGHAFLSSCNLYVGLAPTQFTDDQARIYWVLSLGIWCSHHDCGRMCRVHLAWACRIEHLHDRHRSIGRGWRSHTREVDCWFMFYILWQVNSMPSLHSMNHFTPLFLNENLESNSSYSLELENESSA